MRDERERKTGRPHDRETGLGSDRVDAERDVERGVGRTSNIPEAGPAPQALRSGASPRGTRKPRNRWLPLLIGIALGVLLYLLLR